MQNQLINGAEAAPVLYFMMSTFSNYGKKHSRDSTSTQALSSRGQTTAAVLLSPLCEADTSLSLPVLLSIPAFIFFSEVFALPNPSSHDHDVFLKLSSFSVSVSASMPCLAGCTVGKMNRHTHSTSASLLVHCPRWQRWAPGLVWLSLVWFPLWSQSGPARPCS